MGLRGAQLRVLERLQDGLEPDEADIEELHEAEIGLHDEIPVNDEKEGLSTIPDAPAGWLRQAGLRDYLQGIPIAFPLHLADAPVEEWTKYRRAWPEDLGRLCRPCGDQ